MNNNVNRNDGGNGKMLILEEYKFSLHSTGTEEEYK